MPLSSQVIDFGQAQHERIKATAEAARLRSAKLPRPDFGRAMLNAMRRRHLAEPDSRAVARWTRCLSHLCAQHRRWERLYGERSA